MADRIAKKVAWALKDNWSTDDWSWGTQASAALEACHHEELVEALGAFIDRYDETYCNAIGDAGSNAPSCMEEAYVIASAVLAKVKDQGHG